MSINKAIFKTKPFCLWSIISSIVIVLMIAVLILTSFFYDALCSFLGNGKPIISGDNQNAVAYEATYKSKQEATAAANKFNEQICEEGIVLLKNENVLPVKTGNSDKNITTKPRVSVFGKNSVNLVYGGSGSGSGNSSTAATIYGSLSTAGYEYNPILKAFYDDNNRSGEGRSNNPKIENAMSVLSTGETPIGKYNNSELIYSYDSYNDLALIVISRIGGEGWDIPRTMDGAEGARNKSDHFLQLDQNETDLLAAVCAANFKKVVVIINSSSSMELGFLDDENHYAYQSKIGGAVWIGAPGNSGIMALGRVLSGEVNPSGRLVDTYARDFKLTPSWQNFGTYLEKDGNRYIKSGSLANGAFVDYEEGIYMGYRYYETRGFTDGDAWYRSNVVYPFGYGKSYTNFEWTIKNKSELSGKALNPKQPFEVEITVKNKGTYTGKDVVQLYVTAPYENGKVEKAHKVLAGYAKTPLLKANEEKSVVIQVDPYYFASYDYNDANLNSNKGYELDKGKYVVSVSSDSHTVIDSFDLNLSQTYNFGNDNITGNDVLNRFEDSDDELGSVMSRSNFAATFPQPRTVGEKEISTSTQNALSSRNSFNPNIGKYEMPTQGVSEVEDKNGKSDWLLLKNMVGVSYDENDTKWNKFLSQLTSLDMKNLISKGALRTIDILPIGKPATIDQDGPSGFSNLLNKSISDGVCYYASECVIASTWNDDIALAYGKSIGDEALIGYDGTTFSGWYAPGVNLHRSQFGGRNFEYYSEDSFLSGMMAANVIKGAQSKGVYSFVKHFALNEQETSRNLNGLATWANEQTIREVYLRPFEMAVKIGETRAMMSSFNRIGTRWTGGDYRLLTEVLRDEWGFRGMVISDFTSATYMNAKQMHYAGNDLNLSNETNRYWNSFDEKSADDVAIARQATKNILYTIANSNAMNVDVIGYNMPSWLVIMIVVLVAILILIVLTGFFAIKSANKKVKKTVNIIDN